MVFSEGQEIGFVELSLENQLIKHESVMVSLAINDGERELCQCKVRVVDDICKFSLQTEILSHCSKLNAQNRTSKLQQTKNTNTALL